ncbi:hemerythrin domain-containing protein [Streptacidiphilus neutrinimicus]|uniref:hemerythrin domain-containing protein n=1 Tax=Streptacidiphilus neutrinimicus TaxID=105420 RepID=UPI0005A902AB|nr:hemerythrin domain-containing protein [Streptacidiphilus neutrinimicus]
MGHGGNVIHELTVDHREVEEMFDRFNALPPGHPGRRDIADEFTIELVRHSVAEEIHLYPAVRQHVIGGDQLADREIADHAKAEQLLKKLEGLDIHQAEFDTTAAQLITEVTAHVADEEQNLFPALAAACTGPELDELGEKVRSAKDKAPTRPHPSASDTPPLNKILAPGAGLVDRARDLLSGRGRR